ncbi:MAG: orotidine-5'-phosphate decarboxylase [Terracidiphilus sp.]|jgi:orotidine-5'-phosphate decarboxylase
MDQLLSLVHAEPARRRPKHVILLHNPAILYHEAMLIPERMNPSFGFVYPPVVDVEGARNRLIVALDVPDAASANVLVSQLEKTCLWFKVGLELFVAAGPAIIEPLVARGHSVFLDLKFFDIPNTVAGAVRSAASLGVKMMTIHAAGGPVMLSAAKAALAGVADPPELLAITTLTSMDQAQVNAVGLPRSPAEQVELLARMGLEAGISGFVCSPQEVASLRTLTGPEGTLVVPGIRPSGAAVNDQKRIATPSEALREGASYLVVGRPITQAPDPAEAATAILKEMAGVLEA